MKNIQKSFGFTLAEVLITLAIIGIIAAMTMPTLIQNHQKQVYVTGAKKAVNTISNMFQKAMADEGVSSISDTEVIQAGCLVDFAEDGYGNAYIPDLTYRNRHHTDCSNVFEDAYGSNSLIVDLISKNIKTTNVSICNIYNSNGYSNTECSINAKFVCKNEICCQNGCPSDSQDFGGAGFSGYASSNLIIVNSADGIVYYFQRSMDGLNIVFDTNGKKGPNQEGRDVFCLIYVNGILSNMNCGTGHYGKNPEISHLSHLMNNGWNMDY